MKNSKLRRALLLLASAVLLVSLSVGATLAYLTSEDSVRNTFTVGHVTITLDEADVNPDGTVIPDVARVDTNEYKLFPGHTYTKDPIVHVDANSEKCWIFVEVINGIDAIEDKTNGIVKQMETLGWSKVTGEENVYAYKEIVGAGMNIPVFTQFKIADTVDNDTLADYATKENEDAVINVTAYAVQADGFGSAQAAWDAAKTELYAD